MAEDKVTEMFGENARTIDDQERSEKLKYPTMIRLCEGEKTEKRREIVDQQTVVMLSCRRLIAPVRVAGWKNLIVKDNFRLSGFSPAGKRTVVRVNKSHEVRKFNNYTTSDHQEYVRSTLANLLLIQGCMSNWAWITRFFGREDNIHLSDGDSPQAVPGEPATG